MQSKLPFFDASRTPTWQSVEPRVHMVLPKKKTSVFSDEKADNRIAQELNQKLGQFTAREFGILPVSPLKGVQAA